MEKEKYKATFLKTFLCFMIYKVITVIITRITRYIQITMTIELVTSTVLWYNILVTAQPNKI